MALVVLAGKLIVRMAFVAREPVASAVAEMLIAGKAQAEPVFVDSMSFELEVAGMASAGKVPARNLDFELVVARMAFVDRANFVQVVALPEYHIRDKIVRLDLLVFHRLDTCFEEALDLQ